MILVLIGATAGAALAALLVLLERSGRKRVDAEHQRARASILANQAALNRAEADKLIPRFDSAATPAASREDFDAVVASLRSVIAKCLRQDGAPGGEGPM